jgi:hypothetical protein
LTITNLAARRVQGKFVTPQKVESQMAGPSHFSLEFVAVDAGGVYTAADPYFGYGEPKLKSAPQYLLKNPLSAGTAWETTLNLSNNQTVPAKAVIESVADVVAVPAGTFRGCIRVRTVGADEATKAYETTVWYAPSVGGVKAVVHTTIDMVSQLESFTK